VICDAHCHFFSARFFETLARDTGGRFAVDWASAIPAALGWDPPGTSEQLADRWADELDRHSVDRVVLIASVPNDEESVGIAVRRHPERCIAFCMVNPLADGAPARVTQAATEMSIRGLCLFPAMHRYSLLDERVAAVVQAAAAGNCAVFVHCGVLSIGARRNLGLPSRFEARFGQPLDVQALAANWPRVPFIIPHFGAGFFREALIAADMCPNVYLDTSSSNSWIKYTPGLTLADVFQHAVQVLGPERLLFGTDSSFFPRGWQRSILDTQRSTLDELRLDARDVEAILGDNLHRLFPVS
jgi:predicted TIM-barrel fold metal-dependent hydrolase